MGIRRKVVRKTKPDLFKAFDELEESIRDTICQK